MKDMDEWVEWMTLNPELAEKYYPEIMEGLTERIKKWDSFRTALIIQKLPNHFPKWKTEIENFFGIKRTKMILQYIDLIKIVLIESKYTSEIEQIAVESVRAELTEQLEYWERELITSPPQQSETKTDKLKEHLTKYGFFELLKIKQLSEQNKQDLIDLIIKNKMPYGIAMFDFLGFCEYLDREQGTKYKANNILSRLFNEKAKDGTSAKHYRRSLIKFTTPRYKAGEYKDIVQKDYNELK